MSPEEKAAWEKETSELINLITTGKAITDSLGELADDQQPVEGGKEGEAEGSSLGTVQANESPEAFTVPET